MSIQSWICATREHAETEAAASRRNYDETFYREWVCPRCGVTVIDLGRLPEPGQIVLPDFERMSHEEEREFIKWMMRRSCV